MTVRSYLPLATSHRDVYESVGISYPLLGAALGGLLLLLGLNLIYMRQQLVPRSSRCPQVFIFPPLPSHAPWSIPSPYQFERTFGV
jgi:hypothetical protein